MDAIHNILNYSFAPLDMVNYINQFALDRRHDLKRMNLCNSYAKLEHKDPEKLAHTVCEMFCDGSTTLVTPSAGFGTYDVLGSVIRAISEEGTISTEYNHMLNVLQKRFEVYHRIFDSYDSNFKKSCDVYNSLQLYAMFAVVLGLRFLMQRNFNDFNTVLKLNDVVMKSGWPFESRYEDLICFSVCIEQKIIEELNG